MNMIGAAPIDRPFGTSIADGKKLPPLFISDAGGLSTERSLDFLLGLPKHFEQMFEGKKPIFLMFAAMYD